ncbi:hypothetical protein SAMN05216304_107201 [Bosea sp. OK403]|nr:hypothetical protein [Bosea sp. OK403]SFJ39923.1 hypothetical protein SAMN05216304_107201 [Bosea sp. OK403]
MAKRGQALYAAGQFSSGLDIMKRKRLFQIIGILGLATMLAACDKCGEPLRPFNMPKSCGDSRPAG